MLNAAKKLRSFDKKKSYEIVYPRIFDNAGTAVLAGLGASGHIFNADPIAANVADDIASSGKKPGVPSTLEKDLLLQCDAAAIPWGDHDAKAIGRAVLKINFYFLTAGKEHGGFAGLLFTPLASVIEHAP